MYSSRILIKAAHTHIEGEESKWMINAGQGKILALRAGSKVYG